MRRLQQLIAAVLLCAAPLFAQDEIPTRVTNQNRMGPLSYSTSVGSDIEQVDLATGALNVHIPIWSVPGRGMDASLSFHWNSNYLMAAARTDALGRPFFVYAIARDSGWRGNHPTTSSATLSGTCMEGIPTGQSGRPVFWTNSYMYYDEEGGQHSLPLQSGGGACGAPATLTNPDLTASGMLGNTNGVTLADGTQVGTAVGGTQNPLTTYSGSYKDSNGNTRDSVTDTLGRPLYTVTDAPHDANGRPTQTMFTIKDPNGVSQNIVVVWTPLTITTSFGTSGVNEASGLLWYGISSIALPNGTAYQFHYEPDYGELTEIDLPSGGVIKYTWANYTYPNPTGIPPAQESRRYVATRTETVNGLTNAWNIQLITDPITDNDQSTVTFPAVATPSGGTVQNQSVFISNLGSVVDAKIFAGAATGTPLREYEMVYSADGDPSVDTLCDTSDSGPPAALPMGTRLTRLITTLDNGQATKKEFDYDSLTYTYYPHHCQTLAQSSQAVTFTASRGNVIKIREYGFGTLGNGDVTGAPLLRTTARTYWHDSHPAYVTANIVDKIASEIVTDNVNNLTASELDLQYDQTALTATTNLSSVPAHDATFSSSFTTRGNPTQVQRRNNADGTLLTATYNYDDLGNIRSIQDPKGNLTQWFYADSFDSATDTCAPSSNSFAYISKKIDAAGHNFFVVRRACTGQVHSHQDDNDVAAGAKTSYTYDLMGRVLSTTLPDGGSVKNNYHGDPIPPFVSVTTAAAPNTDIIKDTHFDGLHRVVQALLAGGQIVDTSYDAYGRVFTVSNPHDVSPALTDGITTTFYDALSRPIQVTKQDGGIVKYSYSGTETTVTDESGRQRRSITDALGRLAEVDEPGDSYPGVNASGNITVSGSLRSVGIPTQATGTITISGTERTYTDTSDCNIVNGRRVCATAPDTGTVWITVNGLQKSYPFGDGDSATSVATNLASDFNTDPALPVTASLSGTTITFTSKTSGSGTNYSLSCGQTSHANSFIPTASGANLTGGTDGGNVVWDSGTATLSLGSGFTASAPYGQNTNATAAAVAAALAGTGSTGLNRAGSPVNATANGATLTITYNTAGTAGDMGVTLSSSTGDSAHFSGGSFCSPQCTSALVNGDNPEGPSLDHNFYVTKYIYDALGNLICVEQHGNVSGTPCPTVPLPPTSTPVAPDPNNPWRLRRFAYNSLGQLVWASNPESGVITYTYDLDGNLSQKTSPQANQLGSATTTITYCYDSVNRLLAKGYANSPTAPQQCSATAPYLPNPAVANTFDEGTNGIGHLTSLTDQAGSGIYTYDIMGRITTEQRTIAGKTNTMSYEYTLDGSIKNLHYPSGAIVAYTYDTAGRMNSAVDSVNGINYATGATGSGSYASFGADGSLASFTQGYKAGFSGITNVFTYNQRLQPCRISAGTGMMPGPCGDTNHANILDLGYDFHAGASDNGNVMALTNFKDTNRSQTFGYDLLNRITSAQNAGTDCNVKPINPSQTVYWGNNYVYDPWGNLLQKTVTKCNAEPLTVGVSNLNQITSAGYAYDAAGNVTSNASDSVNAAYDEENRIKSANGFTYTYDADGERVEKSNGTTGTLYWYMSPGIIGESDLNGVMKSEYVFFAGERIARQDYPAGSVAYYFSDHLKTTSIVTDSSGVIKNESDYYPWGGEIQLIANDSNHYKFNGKERDETGLDYYGARYYSNKLGRFVTPDWAGKAAAVPYADFADPQSLNLYTYVRNIPSSRIDPDGHQCPPCTEEAEEAAEFVAEHPQLEVAVEGLEEDAGAVGETIVRGGGVALRDVFGPGLLLLSPTLAGDPHESQKLQKAKSGTNRQLLKPDVQMAHRSNKRKSRKQTHEEGESRRKKDRGGEKGDERRRPPRKRPPGWKGPWPPQPPKPPKPPVKPPEQPPSTPGTAPAETPQK